MIRGYKTFLQITLAAVIIAGASCARITNSERGVIPVQTNLQIIQQMFGQMADQILAGAKLRPNAVVGLRVRPFPQSWITENVFADRISAHSHKVRIAADSGAREGYIMSLDNASANVRYTNAHRRGLFGKNYAERSVIVNLNAQVYDSETGDILYSEILNDSFHDTIMVGDISLLENDNIPMTKADPPDEPFIDRFVEPFVIVGAAGVAIFLFFHIRS